MSFIENDETLENLDLNGICVIQKKNAFRFGADAILLSKFAHVKNNEKVVDLCSGTGIIPFYLAGVSKPSEITGIEIQEEMALMAQRSVEYNIQNTDNEVIPNIRFINGDLKDMELLKTLPKVDVVTVNPPYKLHNSGILNPNDKFAIAKHEVCCTLEDVILSSKFILRDGGRFYMVQRPERLVDIFCLMRKYQIEPKRVKLVYPSIEKPANLILIEGRKNGGTFLKWDVPQIMY